MLATMRAHVKAGQNIWHGCNYIVTEEDGVRTGRPDPAIDHIPCSVDAGDDALVARCYCGWFHWEAA
jgi:hypothetical protein